MIRRLAVTMGVAILGAPAAFADVKVCRAPILSIDLSGCEPVEGLGESAVCEGDKCKIGEAFDQTTTRLFSCSERALKGIESRAAAPNMADDKTIHVTGDVPMPVQVPAGSECFA